MIFMVLILPSIQIAVSAQVSISEATYFIEFFFSAEKNDYANLVGDEMTMMWLQVWGR